MVLYGFCALQMCEVGLPNLHLARKGARLIAYIGNLRSLNELAKQARADHIIHTGDFGFYDDSSLERIADK